MGRVNRPTWELGLAILCVLAGAAVLWQVQSDSFGVVNGLPDPALAPRPGLFGVNADLSQYDDPQSAAQHIQGLGFDWVRQVFPWDRIETRPGEFDWLPWDGVIDALSANGLRTIAVLRYSPDWARTSDDHNAPPDDPQDFAAFAAAFASRYGDRVDVYQIWDEPNLSAAWGGPANPPAYAVLLQSAHTAIHASDPAAVVLLGGLAPTAENGPRNLSDLNYLRKLYDLDADRYFDAVAAKPYGFNASPDERTAAPDVLNFSRLILIRAEMERRGDGRKLVWATNFGWNALPAGWSGDASIWGQVTESEQAEYTAQAYQRAATEWPWAGPLVLDQFNLALPADDPRHGFDILSADGALRPVGLSVQSLATQIQGYALPGVHLAADPAAAYEGAWEFSELGADIPENFEDAKLVIRFWGSDIALHVRRGDYRGALYCRVDGQPANVLPMDARGSYLVLTSPELRPEGAVVPVARGLDVGFHVLEIEPERGWDQWAIQGFSVGNRNPLATRQGLGATLLAVGAVLASLGLRRGGIFGWTSSLNSLQQAARRLGSVGQLAASALLSALVVACAWLTWGTDPAQLGRRFGDSIPILVTLASATVFYVSPWLILTLLSALLLLVIFTIRFDIALALIALSIPFYLQPRPLFDKAFSMVELLTILAAAAWVINILSDWRAGINRDTRPAAIWSRWPGLAAVARRLGFLDWAVLAFVVIAIASTFQADVRGVALRELRVVILGPAIYYGLLRTSRLDARGLWRVMDAFVLGAVLVAAIGLVDYARGFNLITAEEGLQRLRSVYGSPNNVGLYLGRAAGPILAVIVIGPSPRRWVYLAAAALVAPAILLTYSKGAILLGVPAALATVLLFWRGRRALFALAAATAAAAGAAFIWLRGNPRFSGLLDFNQGTNFFRTRIWQSALSMIRDHPILGVGPDNFLYAYRGRYILPDAWQDPNHSHPHNVLLDYAARLGLLGLAAAVGMQIGFWRTALAAYRRHRADPTLAALAVGLMASMVDFLAHGLVDASYFYVDLAYAFFLTLGLACRLAYGSID